MILLDLAEWVVNLLVFSMSLSFDNGDVYCISDNLLNT